MFAGRFVVLTLFAVCVAADPPKFDLEKLIDTQSFMECIKSSGATAEDVDMMSDKKATFTEPALCFMKCISEKMEMLDAEGKVNDEKMWILPESEMISDDLKKEIRDCLSKLPPVKTCTDMETFNKCFDSLP